MKLGSGVAAGPGEEGPEEVFSVGEDVVVAAPLQVAMDRHEGGEPEAGGDHPVEEGGGIRLGLTVAAGDQRLKAKFPGQPAEPDGGEFEDHFPLEGADAGSQGAQGIYRWVHLVLSGVWLGVCCKCSVPVRS